MEIKNNRKQVILVDGTVGVGKSTLAKKIGEKMNVKVFEELANQDTITLLERFYPDQKRWSFTLQIHFLNERFKMIKEIQKNNGGILDRSIFGDRIFAELLNEDGMMSDEEYRTYSSLLDSMLEHVLSPTILIYIDCEVDTAIERIEKRHREMELEVPRLYWERLNEKYKKWYDSYNVSTKICIDARSYDPTNGEDIDLIVDLIKSKISYSVK